METEGNQRHKEEGHPVRNIHKREMGSQGKRGHEGDTAKQRETSRKRNADAHKGRKARPTKRAHLSKARAEWPHGVGYKGAMAMKTKAHLRKQPQTSADGEFIYRAPLSGGEVLRGKGEECKKGSRTQAGASRQRPNWQEEEAERPPAKATGMQLPPKHAAGPLRGASASKSSPARRAHAWPHPAQARCSPPIPKMQNTTTASMQTATQTEMVHAQERKEGQHTTPQDGGI